MYDDRHRVLALVLAETGMSDHSLGNHVPDGLWERLEGDDLVVRLFLKGHIITDDGKRELRRLIAS